MNIAICSALFFNSNHEKALVWLHISGYFPQVLSLSRFNRRVHRMKDFIEYCFESISEIFLSGDLYIEDSMPLPVCKRARASRNKKVRGREYCGYCVAKKEKFFGFRLHLIVDRDGVPVSLAILPGADHDLTPLYEITSPLPQGATVIGDKAFNCQLVESELAEMGVFLMPKRRKNMKKQWPLFQERFILCRRRQIETSFRHTQRSHERRSLQSQDVGRFDDQNLCGSFGFGFLPQGRPMRSIGHKQNDSPIASDQAAVFGRDVILSFRPNRGGVPFRRSL